MARKSKVTTENTTGQALTLATIAEPELRKLGLSTEDLPAITQLSGQVTLSNLQDISTFGRAVSEHTASYTDKILETVRSSNSDIIDKRLNEIVAIARETSAQPFGQKPKGLRALPVVGPLLGRFQRKVAKAMDGFESAKHQIDSIVQEVGQVGQQLMEANGMLDEMHEGILEQYKMLGLHIAAGRLVLQRLQDEARQRGAGQDLSPVEVQQLADLQAVMGRLDKRLGDMSVRQSSVLLAAPQVRMIQASNQMLVDKFCAIREVTIPAWKQGYAIRSALSQQQRSVQLATQIDDATNALLLENAALLKQNSISTAKANERLVIDVKTVQSVKESVLSTVQAVIQIRRDGAADRRQAERDLEVLNKDMKTLVLGKGDRSGTPRSSVH